MLEYCAIWATICCLSTGLNGSCCDSCAVIRRRKSPWSICWLVPLGWITGLLLVMLLTLILLSHPESFVDQALRGFEDLDIVLILARGLDHLDQLGGAIDRSEEHTSELQSLIRT